MRTLYNDALLLRLSRFGAFAVSFMVLASVAGFATEELTVQELAGLRFTIAPPVVLPSQARLESSIKCIHRPESKSSAVILLWSVDPTYSEGPLELTTTLSFSGNAVRQFVLPLLNGDTKSVAATDAGAWPARYVLGRGAAGPGTGTELALPAIGVVLTNGQVLGLGLDPFNGAAISAVLSDGQLQVRLVSTYGADGVSVGSESRTCVVTAGAEPVPALFDAFYATIPDIQPGPDWLHRIRLVYYDYLSDRGEGWFRDVDELSRRIPDIRNRQTILLCLHGWYDYLGRYAFNEGRGRLDRSWVAFPSSRKVPMSLKDLRRRLDYARDRGFRAVLYFADGILADDKAPGFRPERVFVDAGGRTEFPVWHGPDTVGRNRYQDPSNPEVRRFYQTYLQALLKEFGRHVDGFVWDETFYIRREWVAVGPQGACCADRAMMSLVSELTRKTQTYGHGRLVFLVSDIMVPGLYGVLDMPPATALVAHGTFQDSAGNPNSWKANWLPNYRNTLFSCMWEPIQHADWNRINYERHGRPLALSNGWGDDRGPAELAMEHPALLDEVLRLAQEPTNPREKTER